MQLTLPLTEPPRSIQERFEEFHQKNPEVFRLFQRFASEIRQAGHQHYSARAIIHRIRWHVDIETNSSDGLKINDHFSSRYARLLVQECPVFDGFFELRELKAD